MKTLYNHLLTEARGLLRDEYNYDKLVDHIVDLLMADFDLYLNLDKTKKILDFPSIKTLYPEWIGDITLYVTQKHEAIGLYSSYMSVLKNDKLYFDVGLNMINVAEASGYKPGNHSALLGVRKCLEKALHHELKHAFTDWIHRVKKLSSPIKHKYFIDQEKLNIGSSDIYWDNFFRDLHYLGNKVEMEAYQQQYLHFYKNTTFGRLFIKVIRNEYGTPSKLFQYLEGLDKNDELKSFYGHVSDLMSSILLHNVSKEEIDPIIHNSYFRLTNEIGYAIQYIKPLEDWDCERILKRVEGMDFYGVKVSKSGSYTDRFIKFLNDIKKAHYKFLGGKILNRLFKDVEP